MSVFKHKKGYYGFNFMYKGRRYCRTFKGLSKEDVLKLETVAKAEIIKRGYDISQKKVVYLNEIIESYKLYAQSHCSRPNDFHYVYELFFKLVGNKDIEQVTANDIEKYINNRFSKVKNRTINREIDVIKRIFSLAVENKKLKVNPCNSIKDLRIENPAERYLTKEEEEKLLAVCNPIMRAIILTAIQTGMRQNELLSLKWEDVFFDERYLIARNTKNNKTRKIPLMDKLYSELKNLPHLSEYVFTSPVTLTRYNDVKSTFVRAVNKSGIQHISFHKLRHTTASRLNELGIDIVTIQQILGHADIRTTMLYTHNTPKNIETAFKKLNDY